MNETLLKNILKSIESDIVNIKIKENVYEYTVNVLNNVNKLDLKPILTDNSYKVEISNQNLNELKDNKITITLTKNREKEVYTIIINKNSIITKNDEEAEEFKYKGELWIVFAIAFIIFIFGIIVSKKKY